MKKNQTLIEKKKNGFSVAFASNSGIPISASKKRQTQDELSQIFDNMAH
jgi:hypothetical protein